MFGLFKKKSESEVVAQYKKDNVTLMSKIARLESTLEFRTKERDEEAKDSDKFEDELSLAKEKVKSLESENKDLKNSKPVTYAQGRKILTKAKLKSLRSSLEAV